MSVFKSLITFHKVIACLKCKRVKGIHLYQRNTDNFPFYLRVAAFYSISKSYLNPKYLRNHCYVSFKRHNGEVRQDNKMVARGRSVY